MENKHDDFGKSAINAMQTEYCIFSSQLADEEQLQEKNEEFQDKLQYPSMNKLIMSEYIVNNNYNESSYQDNEDLLNIINSGLVQNEINQKKENESKLEINSKCILNDKNKFQNKSQNLIEEFEIPKLIKSDPDSTSFYEVKEKCEIKDYIGSHKVYEISFFHSSLNEKKIKSFRRYQNFHKFDKKLKKCFPYFVVPRLPPKNPLAKIISPDSEFYENRIILLNNYVNFIWKNDFLSKSKEFLKFVNEAEFDEEFFENDEINYNYYFPESSKINDTITNKIYGIFSNIFSSNEIDRRINECEKNLKRMEIYYKFLAENCNNIKDNMNVYMKSIKTNSEIYKKLSSNSLYLKDPMERIENSKESFKKFCEISSEISEINYQKYLEKGIKIKNETESFVAILFGICDVFERYSEYLKIFDNLAKADKYSKSNRLDNSYLISEELKQCESFKKKFELVLIEEVNRFNQRYNNTFIEQIEEFKFLVKGLNIGESLISDKIVN